MVNHATKHSVCIFFGGEDSMKRALAERVKQEMGGPTSNGPPEGMNGVNNGIPPTNKMPRLAAESLSSPMPMSAPVSASPIDHNSIGEMAMELSSREDDRMITNNITTSISSKKRPRSPNACSSGNVSAFQSQKLSDDENDTTPKGRPHRSSKPSANSDDEREEEFNNSTFFLKHQNKSLASELYAYRRRIYLLEKERDYRRKECRIAGKRIGELRGAWRGLEEALGQEMATINLPQTSEVCF